MDNQNITIPIQELQRRFKSVMIRLPILVGNEVVNFALDNFKRQAWLGDVIEPWAKRKNPTKWGMPVKRNGRALLVDSGRLRRSIRMINHTWDSVTVGSDVPYAKAHNEGVRLGLIQGVKSYYRTQNIKVLKTVRQKKGKGSATLKMPTGTKIFVNTHVRHIDQRIPARRFLGNSQYLNARLQRVVSSEIMKATSRSLNNFNYNA